MCCALLGGLARVLAAPPAAATTALRTKTGGGGDIRHRVGAAERRALQLQGVEAQPPGRPAGPQLATVPDANCRGPAAVWSAPMLLPPQTCAHAASTQAHKTPTQQPVGGATSSNSARWRQYTGITSLPTAASQHSQQQRNGRCKVGAFRHSPGHSRGPGPGRSGSCGSGTGLHSAAASWASRWSEEENWQAVASERRLRDGPAQRSGQLGRERALTGVGGGGARRGNFWPHARGAMCAHPPTHFGHNRKRMQAPRDTCAVAG